MYGYGREGSSRPADGTSDRRQREQRLGPVPGKRTLTQQLEAPASGSSAGIELPAASPIQRQPTGSPPATAPSAPAVASTPPAVPSTPGTARASTPASEAYHAPTSAHDPNAPASRNADWEDIDTAATDLQAQQALDIAWIDALPAHLQNSIDEGFADTAAEASAAHAIKADDQLAKIGAEIDKMEKDLQATTIARLAQSDPSIKHKHGKLLEDALMADPAYAATKAQLESDCAARIAQRRRELRAAADGPMTAGRREDSVATPPTARVTRLQGKALARTNFMSWAIDVLGSTDAVKQHFLSLREVSRQPGMLLVESAKLRFEGARAEFEAKHPGYTFPSTDVAQSLRGFHQARQGIGMLGHALGIAFDLFAYDNPNQRLGNTDNFAYALDRFGGEGDKRGRSAMTLGHGGEDAIAQLGRDTEGHRSSPAGEAIVQKIREQFDEMAATSERLQASMAPHLTELSDARDDYFNSKEMEKELAQATRDERNADRVADKHLKDEKFSGDAAAREARRAEIQAEITSRKLQLSAALQGARDRIPKRLEHAFAEWIAVIEADIAAAQARQAQSDAEIAAQAAASRDLDAIDVHAPDAADALNAFADTHQLKKRTPVPRAVAYKAILKAELAARHRPRDKTDPLSPSYIRNEIAALRTWQARLHDPDFVFGEGKVVAAAPDAGIASTGSGAGPVAGNTASMSAAPTAPATAPGSSATPTAGAADTTAPAKHWATKMRVSNAPLMQFIEHGFIRHDDMPARPGARDLKQVFNAEVATTLARFGFSPGATYRDTMHFDFIEGYASAPGGRSQPNMNRTKYGPSGDIPPPAPKQVTPSAAKQGTR